MSLATDGSSMPTQIPRPRRVLHRAGGFNLVELLVVMTLAGIVMGIGIPSYRYVTNSNRVSTEVNALLGDMMLARSEAIKQAQSVTVCPSQGGTACDATTNWQHGWIVFSDVNGDGAFTVGTDTLLRVQKAFATATDTFQSDNAVEFVTYNREGFAVNQPTTLTNYITVTLHTAPANAQWTRCLQIGTYGGLTTEHSGTGGCQ
ncbi:MAG TPA: GspH/FimT family pseudopilin [Steroidobacteraceae bacterium]|jgi:prepilin-type N-terminal cleavage/methylation domain-containing protein|nr:GspH/FimT family pseudopilin [Steroidobacteraceae bacterium]